LTGGAGADRFVFDTLLNASTNRDTITDFVVGTDKVVLSQSIFGGVSAVTADNFYKASNATAGADSADRIIYNTSNGYLYYDADGAGGSAAVAFATLSTRPSTLSWTDFVVL